MDRRTITYLAAVIAGLTLVWGAMVAYGAAQFFSFLHFGLTSCLPDDFPTYPGATVASIVVSDAYGDCTVQYRTSDAAGEVEAFFKTNLDEGDWTVTAAGSDPLGRMINFSRESDPNVSGYVQIYSIARETQFQIDIEIG